MKGPRIIEIEWEDSCTPARPWCSQKEAADFHREGAICVTVGYLIHSDRRAVTVAQSLNGDDPGGLWRVPRKMVRRLRRLR